VTTKDTNTDLSVDIYLVNEYAQYSNAFIGLSLVDDLLFKQSGDDERNNFTLVLGIEHYLQNNFRISASFFNYLTDKKENADYYAIKNATGVGIGIDYKF
jgi:predicted porin